MAHLFSRIHYPKLITLFFSFLAAYALFYGQTYPPLHNLLLYLGYFGTFIAGILYSYGFTAAPATAILLSISKEQNLIFAGLVGGLGALTGDLIIFHFIRYTLRDEIETLSKTKIIQFIEKEEEKILGHFQKHASAIFAGFVIASPLPTEIGVGILSSFKHLSIRSFAALAYILHTIGIFIILFIGSLI